MDPDTVAALRAAGETDPHIGTDGRVPHGSSDDPDLLDFSANTNPRVPPGTREVFAAAFDTARSYPNDGYPDFRAAAAEFVGCEPEEVVPTAGGLEAIRLAMQTSVRTGESVLLPAPSFGEYAREVRLQGGEPAFVDHDAILDADPDDHAMAVVCNPNNPTGECYDADALRAFADRCREVGTTLLVDEAFLGFTDEPSLSGREGVLVARSLTKLFGLPGVRMGFAVGTGGALDRLATARRAWSMSAAAAAVGTHCYRADEFVAETRERVARERERMRDRLATRFDVFPSDAPFLSFDTGDTDVEDLLATAREAGIALRDARTFRRLDSHVRVAVRRPDENDRLLEALDV
ncbi:threonine-phosphate decarboxylase CobD [Halomicroarcula sp. F28]|uniref:threonine-phosphate decarboxylase CobD n=1 Tax=Haloarcula salinisoli TaxID=2487746 RepID=UPI001C73025D|nr:threonine-phosphate decarboxylase CobD [Halomicroarcula salinisoli]MBX0286307.1 threonine-phosphate decarboxylase CobD [Halomicroarcula salinisoli]